MTFADLCTEYNIQVAPSNHHHRTRGRESIDCPFCSPDSQRWRMGYHLTKHYFTCWVCGSLPIGKVLLELTKEPWPKVKQLIERLKGDDAIPEETAPTARGTLRIPTGVAPTLLQIHRDFLRGRRIDPDTAQKLWGARGIGISKSGFNWRMFIPVFYRGEMVSFTTRTVATPDRFGSYNHKRRQTYRSASPEEEVLSHKTLLYGEDLVPGHCIVVVEGPLDAWAVGPGAVATLGIQITEQQVHRISKYPTRVICFDAEPEAQVRARKLVAELKPFPGDTINVELASGKDPSRASEQERATLRSFISGVVKAKS